MYFYFTEIKMKLTERHYIQEMFKMKKTILILQLITFTNIFFNNKN